MRALRSITLAMCVIAFAATADRQLVAESNVTLVSAAFPVASTSKANSLVPATLRYQLDASQSKFIARAQAGGLLWFKGHDHLIAVREFTGEAQLTPASITPASLSITARTASMVETSSVFTEPQKQIINKELREIVLLPAQYPEIVFKSTNVTGKTTGNDQYDLKISGDLTLHGVTKPITIPTKLTISGNQLRAQGEFSISRSDFKVKATSAVHGLVRVQDKVKFTFDIVGRR
ncbi:MAG TPA: YceI family protein [Pyrinomonadaceae bacterium]